MSDLPELAFTDTNVETLIFEIAACQPGKELYVLGNQGVSDAAIDLWFESGADDAYINLEAFRNGCKTAVEMREVLQKFDTSSQIYMLAGVLALDAWQNEPEPSEWDIKRILHERKQDAKEMQRRRD